MPFNSKSIQVLKDLIKINIERVIAYKKAAEGVKDGNMDLQVVFFDLANESWNAIHQLSQKIEILGGAYSNKLTPEGKVYRVWADLNAIPSGNNEQSILESCSFSEEATLKVYDVALEANVLMDTSTKKLLMMQQLSLRKGHSIIRQYRNMSKSSFQFQ